MVQDKAWFQGRLLGWFDHHGRDLPWRKTHDPYKILVSEIMLQQTQVDRVIPKYKGFLKLFPTVRALAAASPAAVIQAWSGLGYNRRALYLKRTAEAIVKKYAGKFPSDIAELQKLPGVGTYTARAVAVFAFKQDLGPVDTNISRVLHRWFYGVEVPRQKANAARLARLAEVVVPPGNGWAWNHALMDFGALVCAAKRPKCAGCPMRVRCRAYPAISKMGKEQWSMKRRRVERFTGSNRYWRGRVIELLRSASGHSVPFASLVDLLGSGMTPLLLNRLAVSLAKDQLVVLKRSRLSLPRS